MGLAGQGRAANLRHFSAFGRGAQWGQRESTQREGGFLLELQKSGRIPGYTWAQQGPAKSTSFSVWEEFVYIYIILYIYIPSSKLT